jgi:hypothetical protein
VQLAILESTERRQMKRGGAEGLAAVYRRSPAANEEFTAMGNALDTLARPESGWDPYEVWRTRVKAASTVMQERKSGTLRWRVRFALRRAAVAHDP